MRSLFIRGLGVLLLVAGPAACGRGEDVRHTEAGARVTGSVFVVPDTMIDQVLPVSGVAQAVQQSTLSTKIMGTVVAVTAVEGAPVQAGQVLVRIDARELNAKRAQVQASQAAAEAVLQDARVQAARLRSLYADSAAPKAQLDAAETGLARAEAGMEAARAAGQELEAVAGYSEVRAPFSGRLTRRFVDAGAFAAPGAPLVTVEDASRLRLSAWAAPEAVRGYHAGDSIRATVEDSAVAATIEGIVPAGRGNLVQVNALVPNPGRGLPSGAAATLLLVRGRRAAVLVPQDAIVRQGDLTGVYLVTPAGNELRWVRLGQPAGNLVEVAAGLAAGDRVIIPQADLGGGR